MADLGSKSALKASIDNKIFTNTSFEVSAEDLRSSFEDTIDTLCARAVSFEETTYDDLVSLINTGGLFPGTFYSFDYECIHRIPGTSELNTASPQYAQVIEKFVVQALDVNKINPWVRSTLFPNDTILWDHTDNTAEGTTVPRPGRILFRMDKENDLSAHYDFRAVIFRVGQSDGTTEWTSGQTYSQNAIVNNGNPVLFRATRSWVNETVGPGSFGNFRYAPASPVTNGTRWVWVDGASYLGSSISRTDLFDKLTFTNCSSCHIGPTNFNDGYNAITLSNCTDVELGEGSYNAFLMSCKDVRVTDEIVNSVIGVANNVRGSRISQSFVWSNSDLVTDELVADVVYGCNSTRIRIGNFNNFQFVSNTEIGAGADANSFHNVVNCIVGSNLDGNFLKNIEQTNIGNSNLGNVFNGLRHSTINNLIVACDFDSETSQYGVYDYVTIDDNCSALSCAIGGSVTRVSFGKGCSNIDVEAGGLLNDSVIGHNCTNWIISNGAVVTDCHIGSDCSGWNLTSGALISRTHIGSSVTFLNMTSGSIQDCRIGPSCNNWTFTATGFIRRSTIGSLCANWNFTDNAHIEDSHVGEQVDDVTMTAGSSIRKCTIEHGISGLSVGDGGNVTNSTIKSNCQNISFTGSSTMDDSVIMPSCFSLSFTNGSLIQNSVIGPSLGNKTFDTSNIGTNLYEVTSIKNDSTVETYGNPSDTTQSASVPNDEKFIQISGAAPSINFVSDDKDQYFVFHNANSNITLNGMARNKPYYFMVSNTGASPVDFTFGINYSVGSRFVKSMPTNTVLYICLVRVSLGAIDKIVETYSSTPL